MRIFCWMMLLWSASMPALAGDPARAALGRFIDGLVALEGEFRQRVYQTDGVLREESAGTLAMKAPHLFRWQYETPYEQIVLADGSHVWLYDVDLEQVTVRQQADQQAQSPLVVLTDPGSLDERYRVIERGAEDGLQWLRLEPLDEDGGFQYAELGLSHDRLERMRMLDQLGGRTEIFFSRWQRNPEQPADRFRFVVPDGVDLIGDVTSVPDVRPLSDP